MSLQGNKGVAMIANEQETLQVDIQGMSEHCLDSTKFNVINTARETLRQQYAGKAMIVLSSSPEPAVHQYKPGGTGFLILGTTIGRLEPNGTGSDPMGRWTYIHLRRKNQPPVTIISAYQVCQNPTNRIGNTAYHQQQWLLSQEGRTSVHPRQAFIHDLTLFINRLRAQHHDIILGGDFNEALTDKKSLIFKLATSTNLVDPFGVRHPQYYSDTFGTHVKGT
jgi:exonuclease III